MYKRWYFENAAYCGQCNGDGCSHCAGTGVQTIGEYLQNRPFSDPITLAVFFRSAVKELLTYRNYAQ